MSNLTHLGGSAFQWVLQTTWQAAVLAGLILLAQLLLGKRLPPSWRYGLWLLLVVRLLMPVPPQCALSIFNLTRTAPTPLAAASPPPVTPAAPVIKPGETFPAAVADVAEPHEAPLPFPAPVAARPPAKIDWFGVALCGWLAGVCFFGARLVWTNGRFRSRLGRYQPVADENATRLLNDCLATFKITQPVRLIESEEVESPAVYGFWRKWLLLPDGVFERFSTEELRCIFLHELAHIKRGDLGVNWLVAVLRVLHWFNPVLWLAWERMKADRELATDALALAHVRENDRAPYGETILKVLEGLTGERALPGLVGIVESKSQLKERLTAIARPGKPRKWAALAVAALIAGLGLTGAQTEKGGGSSSHPDLTGIVRGPANQPVANAVVSIESASADRYEGMEIPSAEDCGKRATTDAQGKFTIKALEPNMRFKILVLAKDFRPSFSWGVNPAAKPLDVNLMWKSTGRDPEEQVHGRVVGPDGKPIPSALIEVHMAHREKEGWRSDLFGDIDGLDFTDAAGEFVIHGQQPFLDCDLAVKAPGFASSGSMNLTTGGVLHEIKLTKGATIRGRLLKDGKPVASAGIGLQRLWMDTGMFSVLTDGEGRFSLVNIPPDRNYYLFGIMRSLKERGALTARRVQVDGDGSVLDVGNLSLEPSFTLAGVVRFADGKPAPQNWTMTLCRTVMAPPDPDHPPPQGPGSRAFLGLEYNLDVWHGDIGKHGEFRFSGVPAETVSLGFMVDYPNKLSPRNASADVAGYRLLGLVVTNKTDLVVEFDAKPPGGKPAPVDYPALSRRPLHGVENAKIGASSQLDLTGRIESTNGQQSLFSGTVLLPDGTPAVNAKVKFKDPDQNRFGALVHGLPNEDFGWTDANGAFNLPMRDSATILYASHAAGFAKLAPDKWTNGGKIVLQPWGRVEGTLRINNRVATNEQIELAEDGFVIGGFARTSTTDEQGRFIFDEVASGDYTLYRCLPNRQGWHTAYPIHFMVCSGKTTNVVWGGNGRPVVGKCLVENAKDLPEDSSLTVSIHTPFPHPPASAGKTNRFVPQRKMGAWQKSEAGRKAMQNFHMFEANAAADGSFQVDDVLPGTYEISLSIEIEDGNLHKTMQFVDPRPKEIVVPPLSNPEKCEPFDAGIVKTNFSRRQPHPRRLS